MARIVDIPPRPGLDEYEAVGHLSHAVRELRSRGEAARKQLGDRTVWMVNSTSQGGGVAEMLPTEVTLLREMGCSVEWMVLESSEPEFFALTKRLHNLVHGVSSPAPGEDDRALYERVNRTNTRWLAERVGPDDVLIVHDPQPLPLAGLVREARPGITTIWRCHIGLDAVNEATRTAWRFMELYTRAYAHAVFSAAEYIPDWLRSKASVIYPGIDPLSYKNRDVSLHDTVQILVNAGLAAAPGPVLSASYDHQATRLASDGSFAVANATDDIGLLARPIIAQISRWDRLKGWVPLLGAFANLKARCAGTRDPAHRRRLELARLVLAGPAPSAVDDDPEGKEVLAELCERYQDLPVSVQPDVALVNLPMADLDRNAYIVNALQRASSMVVQNSLREGFGLTVTEALWKRVPVLTNRRACGPRHQVRHDVDGWLIDDPENAEELANGLDGALADASRRERWGRNGQRHVHDRFLILSALRDWLDLLCKLT